MSKDKGQKLFQAASYLPFLFFARYGLGLEGTEFSGGKLTGPLLQMNDAGTLLFIVTLFVVWFAPRIAGIVSTLAALLCLPLFLYFTIPGVFYRLFSRFEFSVPLRAYVVWDTWAILGILFVTLAIFINLRSCFFLSYQN